MFTFIGVEIASVPNPVRSFFYGTGSYATLFTFIRPILISKPLFSGAFA